jgi:hypothetical protein
MKTVPHTVEEKHLRAFYPPGFEPRKKKRAPAKKKNQQPIKGGVQKKSHQSASGRRTINIKKKIAPA